MTNLILIITVCAVCTMLTRAIPFLVFGSNKAVPKIVTYLGKVLPPTIIATLVIYALRNTQVLTFPHGIPEFVGVIAAAVLHIISRNSLISIGASTVLYMVLLRIM